MPARSESRKISIVSGAISTLALILLASGCATGSSRAIGYDGGADGFIFWLDSGLDGGDKLDGDEDPDGEPVDARFPDGSIPDGAPQQDGATCTGGCNAPPNDCYESQGTCVQGQCVYAYLNAGAGCNDNDNCTTNDQCDGQGHCDGDMIDCTRPHASGGTCVNGTCSGWTCNSGWGNCDGDWNDGCEQSLNDTSHCGSCNSPCPSRPHANLTGCSSGSCQYSCQNPWENCDGNWSNGCEIPTGVANQCDANGLNSNTGCWTAYCGSSSNANAVNFGTWYCFECTTCHEPSAGRCQWCDHGSGRWYPDDACACGSYEDLVCSP